MNLDYSACISFLVNDVSVQIEVFTKVFVLPWTLSESPPAHLASPIFAVLFFNFSKAWRAKTYSCYMHVE